MDIFKQKSYLCRKKQPNVERKVRLNESSIYISLKRLREQLYDIQFMMSKTDRIVYGTPLIGLCRDAMAKFIVAFTVGSQEKKVEYLLESIGYFGVLRCDLEACVRKNIIHFPARKLTDEERKNATGADLVSSKKLDLFETVAKIDTEMCRWQASLAKGKTITAPK